MYGIIYKATNKINGKCYIGQTTRSLERRKWEHFHLAFEQKKDLAFYRSLRKYGKDNFTWTIIDNGLSKEQLNLKEHFWIAFYHSFGSKGYNMNEGGYSCERTPESWEHWRKTRLQNRSQDYLDERERNLYHATRAKKPLQCLETGEIFSCSRSAAESLKLDKNINTMMRCIRKSASSGGQSSSYGFHWKFVPEEEANQYVEEAVQCLETGEIFRSMRQAAKAKQQASQGIRNCCNGALDSYSGYHWRYVNNKKEVK